jgi:hypothetical protein
VSRCGLVVVSDAKDWAQWTCSVLIALVTVCVLAVPTQAETPVDIERITQVYKWMSTTRSPTNFEEIKKVMVRFMPPLQERVPSFLRGADQTRLREVLQSRIKTEMQPLRRLKFGSWTRGQKIAQILPVLLTERWLDNVVAEWLEAPGLGEAPLGRPKELADKTVKATQLPSQITWEASPGFVELQRSSSQIVHEVGGSGSGNGRLERGEWFRLRLVLKKSSTRSLFSTSAFITTGRCVWGVNSGEQELDEMLEQGSKSTAVFEGYLAQKCSDPNGYTLAIRVQDSHRTHSSDIKVRLNPVRAPAHAALHRVTLDTDIPGQSEGDNVKVLRPGLMAELSSGLKLQNSLKLGHVTLSWGLTAWAAKVLDAAGYVSSKQQSVGDGRYIATDDLEIRVGDKDAMRSLQRDRRYQALVSGGQPHVWLAADIRYHQHEKSRVRPPVEPSTVTPNTVTSDVAFQLLEKHLRFVPREESPRTDGAIGAVAGFDVVLDRKAFKAEWQRVAGLGQESAVKASSGGKVAYLQRTYLALPVEVLERQRPKRVKRRPRRVRKPITKVAAKPRPKRTPSLVKIDLGVGSRGLVMQDDDIGLALWNGRVEEKSPVYGSLRLTVGTSLAGVFEASVGSVDVPLGEKTVGMLDARFGLGIAYLYDSLDIFQIQPRLMLCMNIRTATDSVGIAPEVPAGYDFKIANDPLFGFDVAVTLRAALWQTGGLYLDLGYHSVDEGPEINVDYSFGQSESQPLFEGGGFHFDAGLSFFF